MGAPYHQLYAHLVWATAGRRPLITSVFESRLHSAIAGKCESLCCLPLAVGGVEDHVHVVVRMPPTLSISDLAQGVKGASSHLMNHVIAPKIGFHWQGGYGAFTFSKRSLDRVAAYVRNQKAHHANRNLIADYEIDEEEQREGR